MKITGDYHTHTSASDGHSTVGENIAAANEAGLEELAITDHSFKSFLCHLTVEKYDEQERQIEALKGDLHVLHGVEANLVNTRGRIDVPDEIIRRAEVLNLGFHRFLQASEWRGALTYLIVNGFLPYPVRVLIKKANSEGYIKAMNAYPIDTLVHLNQRALVDTEAVCRVAAEKGVYVELNEKHLPTMEKNIDTVLRSGVKLIVGTDSHRAYKIGHGDKIVKFIQKHNIPEDRVYGINGKKPVFKDKRDWQPTNGATPTDAAAHENC